METNPNKNPQPTHKSCRDLYLFLLNMLVPSKLSYSRHRKQFDPNKSFSDLWKPNCALLLSVPLDIMDQTIHKFN